MRTIDLTKKAQKYIVKLPPKHQKQVVRHIIALQRNVEPQDSKKLHGYPYYRVDSGEYRIIYTWDGQTVYVLLIGKRNDSEVYRKLDRGR